MSEKSFAVASVSVAIIWGTFFYPPTPHAAKQADTQAGVALVEPGAAPARARNSLVLLSTSSKPGAPAPHAGPSRSRCAIARINGIANCEPLYELAGD